MTTLTSKVYLKTQITTEDVISCYKGNLWRKEIYELFPLTAYGCINFGYWNYIPDFISVNEREKSQLELYHQLLKFANLNEGVLRNILEVGCGRGHGVGILDKLGFDSYGIDITDSQIQLCKKFYPNLSNKFSVRDCVRSGYPNNFLDSIISVEAPQHFPDFYAFIRESYRILNNRGKFAITTFFYNNPSSKKKIAPYIPSDVSGTHHMIEINKALKYLSEAGFKDVEISKIGDKVFEGFCKWAVQSMSEVNHTPLWQEMYERGYLDYYMISATK